MAFSIEITRPDDLLRLRVDARNMRIDRTGDSSSLVVEDTAQPAFLLVHLAPQAIAEGAFFEVTPPDPDVQPDLPPGVAPQPVPPAPTAPAPGTTPVRMAHGSRLVFKVPANARIPLTIEGLLDWSTFELSVNGIAAIGPSPTPAQIAAAPAIAKPAETDTAL
ncbi:MAG TPA: hypothetical protein VIY56_17480, partial [Vicinamibacterales bacterium]